MLPEKFSYELLSTKVESDLYEKLILQLNKDFQMAGLIFEINSDLVVNDLVQLLEDFIIKLFSADYDGYLNLMYRIDVSESDMAMVKGNTIESTIEEIVWLILKREYQKVWFKSRF